MNFKNYKNYKKRKKNKKRIMIRQLITIKDYSNLFNHLLQYLMKQACL